jgi:hypothetical protein
VPPRHCRCFCRAHADAHACACARCCLDYSISYYHSGFALLSQARASPNSVVDALVNVDVLNAATPVVIAIIGFGTLIWLVERRANKRLFGSQTDGVYFAFVSGSTMGFGDVVPVTLPGRLLTVFWAIFTVLSLTAFSGIVSSNLTVAQLTLTTIDTLGQVTAADVCIEATYPLVNGLVADTFALTLDENEQVSGSDVMLATMQQCVAAVAAGDRKVFVSDTPLLNWIAFSHSPTNNFYVSDPVQANPLSWAFPSNSELRPIMNAAIITMLVNGTWETRRRNLENEWFEVGVVKPLEVLPRLDVPSFVAAVVLVSTWLLACAAQEAQAYWQRRTAAQAQGKGGDAPEGAEDAEPRSATPGVALAAAREAARAAAAAATAMEALAAQMEAQQEVAAAAAVTAAAANTRAALLTSEVAEPDGASQKLMAVAVDV